MRSCYWQVMGPSTGPQAAVAGARGAVRSSKLLRRGRSQRSIVSAHWQIARMAIIRQPRWLKAVVGIYMEERVMAERELIAFTPWADAGQSFGSQKADSPLYSMCSQPNCVDGYDPFLTLGSDGNFYGITSGVGSGNGTFFRITPAGKFTLVHRFNGTSDGGTRRASSWALTGVFMEPRSTGEPMEAEVFSKLRPPGNSHRFTASALTCLAQMATSRRLG